MRKKFAILLTFVLAFAVCLGVLAACDKKEDVTVNITKTTLTLETGKSQTLSASASDGSEIVWTTSNEAVVSVTDKGKVTGEGVGVATVKATVKDGKASASCEVTVKDPVTFVFKDADGNVLNKVDVDREGAPVQISATASDGSTITNWKSGDDTIATVNNGLITGIKKGETKITVSTSTGSGEIQVNVTDSFTGESYDIGSTPTTDKWYYNIRKDGGREFELNEAEFRGDVVTFDYSGNANWGADDIFLAIKNSEVEEGVWHRLNMKINSSKETSVTINGTRVDLVIGNNTVSVCYEQWDEASAIIFFGNGEAGTLANEIRVVITDVSWSNFEPVDLQVPEFTLQGDKITVTDTKNTEGVNNYLIGLFENGNAEPVFTQPIRGKSGTLDTSSARKNGEFTVKIMAKGNLGFSDSAWSDTNVKYNVTNADTPYKLSTGSNNLGGGGSAALTSGKWEFAITSPEYEGVRYDDAYYENGTVTFEGTNGWAADSVQLMRHFGQYAAGTELQITMTLTLSKAEGEAASGGNIRVCGEIVNLEVGKPKTVTVTVTQTSGAPTILIMLGTVDESNTDWPGKAMASDSLHYGPITFSVSDVTVVPKA